MKRPRSRSKRVLLTALTLASATLSVASTFLWIRSLRTFDECYGQADRTGFQIDSFASHLSIFLSTHYRSKPSAPSSPALLDLPNPFDGLEPDKDNGTNSITRQRWALRDTSQWDADAPLLPGFSWHSGLTWAGDGPGHFVSYHVLACPWWFPCALGALLPTGNLARRITDRRSPAHLCSTCNYDLRASPLRCPECGTESSPTNAEFPPASPQPAQRKSPALRSHQATQYE